MPAYYNEFDPFAAAWLRQLISAGHIAPGDVDERSIEDVRPEDLKAYNQCHFFAGIGVWSLALRNVGFPDDARIWTGSCPCQPFSAAGKGAGFADERHLWPAFYHLILNCEPERIAGEQVASADGLAWLDTVQTDLEIADYAFGAVDTCAAGFGAPHIRQRLYWMADACRNGHSTTPLERTIEKGSIGSGVFKPERYFTSSITCRDGKTRPSEPNFTPWVDGSPSVLGRLRGYGNAINLAQAEGFIRVALT